MNIISESYGRQFLNLKKCHLLLIEYCPSRIRFLNQNK